MTVEPVLTEPVSMDHFLAEGRRKLAEKYLDTKMVAFRFEGDMDPDPIQAPLTTHHAMRDVVSAMEQEVYAFRPELIFPFMRDALARFPARLPPEAAYQGPLNDDEYDERVQTCVARLVERVTLERPEEPFEWLDTWLEEEARLEEEEAERAAPTLEQSVEELDLASMTTDELASFAMDVFLRFDADQNGVLDVWEFKEVLKSTALNFNKEEIREIMAESDADGNGIIDYKEFLPIFVELVTSLKSAQETKQQRHEVEDETRTEVEALFIKGMTEEELTLRMQQLFAQFDDDGNGTLDPEEFQRALNSADLGLSRKEINMLLGEADVNDDGCIEYDEFVPVAFRVLVDRARNKQLENEALSSEDGITALLVDEFRGADPTGAGVMHVQDVKRCLKRLAEHAELQLSRSQIVSIVADCEVNPDDGTVHYLRFAPVASGVIHGMIDFGAQKLRAEAVASLASEDTNVGLMRGMSKEEVEHIMLTAFQAADVDRNGGLDREEMFVVLKSVGAEELGLELHQVTALMVTADEDGDGMVDYQELAHFIHDTLHQLAREDLVRDRAFRHAAGAIRSREEILDVVDDSIVISEKSGGIAQAPGEMRMPQWQGPAGVYAVGGRDGISSRRRQTDDRHLGERTHG
jgi:Ca2+-binding EF-hand superfamily protein